MRAAAVLHVARSPHSSVVAGYERLARRMASRGHTLEIITPADLRSPGADPRLLPLVYPLLVRRWMRTRRDLDLIVFHSYTGWLAPRSPGAPRIVVAFHGFEPLFFAAQQEEARRQRRSLSARYRTMYGALMPRMLRRACRRADLVICLNPAERDALIAGGYAKAENIMQAWHDAPDAFFVQRAHRPTAARLIAVMQWLDTKGTAYLVPAFTELARRRSGLTLLVAGTLADADTVRGAFPEDIRERVEVCQTFDQQQHRAMMASADLFVHASLSEGYSRAVIEAMAAGLPIVTTSTGFAAGVESSDAAVIVPPGDAGALVAAIEPLLDDMPARAALGAAAFAHASRLREADSTGAIVARFESLLAVSR